MESKGTNSPKEIDFANLTAECLWSIFLAKSCYGGALAYAVLSRANKMGCDCSVSLEKNQENMVIFSNDDLISRLPDLTGAAFNSN